MRAAGSNWRLLAWLAMPAVLLAALLAVIWHAHWQHAQLAQALLRSYPQDVDVHPALVRFADAEARPLYKSNCAGCHGADMRGNPALGAPALTGGHWLWGNGSVFQIERILLYGIRSGQPKSLNATDMPAFGLMGRLSEGQVRELVQYLMKLNRRPYDTEAANAGDALYHSELYGCYDCHGADARGNPDYGAPDLTANVWNNGASEQAIHDSIFYGRHRVMPAWKGRLTLEQIRALAVYLHGLSAAAQAPAPPLDAAASSTAHEPAAAEGGD
ncbi:MAG TPA: c-type cytochrome [Steroidobacteraceae bacterium]|nr:c-type cytochrome [Steroidobacteraceae bacterium]